MGNVVFEGAEKCVIGNAGGASEGQRFTKRLHLRSDIEVHGEFEDTGLGVGADVDLCWREGSKNRRDFGDEGGVSSEIENGLFVECGGFAACEGGFKVLGAGGGNEGFEFVAALGVNRAGLDDDFGGIQGGADLLENFVNGGWIRDNDMDDGGFSGERQWGFEGKKGVGF